MGNNTKDGLGNNITVSKPAHTEETPPPSKEEKENSVAPQFPAFDDDNAGGPSVVGVRR